MRRSVRTRVVQVQMPLIVRSMLVLVASLAACDRGEPAKDAPPAKAAPSATKVEAKSEAAPAAKPAVAPSAAGVAVADTGSKRDGDAPAVSASDAPAGKLDAATLTVHRLAGPFADEAAMCAQLGRILAGPERLPPDAFTCNVSPMADVAGRQARRIEVGLEAPAGEGLAVGFALRVDSGWFAAYGLATVGGSVHGDTSSKVGEVTLAAVDIAGKPGIQADVEVVHTAPKGSRVASVRAVCVAAADAVTCSSAFPTRIAGGGKSGVVEYSAVTSISPAGELEIRSDAEAAEGDAWYWPAPLTGKIALVGS